MNRDTCMTLSRFLLSMLVIVIVITSCSAQDSTPEPASSIGPPESTETALPTETLSPTAATTPNPTPVPPSPTPAPPVSVWVAPYLPAALRESLVLADDVLPAQSVEQATYRIQVSEGEPLAQWVFALVAPFPTIIDEVTEEQLKAAWSGTAGAAFDGAPLLMDEDTRDVFAALWGEPAFGAVKVMFAGQLEKYAWDNYQTWGIVPFEALNHRWKVLAIDGNSPVRKSFNPGAYLLTVPVSLAINPDIDAGKANTPGRGEPVIADVQATNWEPDKLTTLILTGVTALVRATAETMRVKGAAYPALDIGETLRSADITHISNEVPFAPDCPFPDPKQEDLVFCSNPEYIQLLHEVGADVVELSGDHLNDWGLDAMRYTLDLYQQAGIPYYGGGYDYEDARKPLLIEHNGNRLALLGCNAKGRGYAPASEENPGAVLCDFEWLVAEIQRLQEQGYLPIVTFQHFEYYTYQIPPRLVDDFQRVAEAGAVIVSGSQAHQPHGMEFYDDAFIHYGLGNLFFDQYHMGLPTGSALLDRHVFYDGRHISTELLGIRFVDYARPRLMDPAEQEVLLENVFEASGWKLE